MLRPPPATRKRRASGQTPRSAASTYDQSTTGSLSPSSRLSHATGRAVCSSSRHVPSSVVLPQPAGAATTVSLMPGLGRSRSTRRSRKTVWSRRGGGCTFVNKQRRRPRWFARPSSLARCSHSAPPKVQRVRGITHTRRVHVRLSAWQATPGMKSRSAARLGRRKRQLMSSRPCGRSSGGASSHMCGYLFVT